MYRTQSREHRAAAGSFRAQTARHQATYARDDAALRRVKQEMASYEEAGQRGGAVQIGWDKSITGANVERAVAKIRRDHPGKKIVVGSGGHGPEGQFSRVVGDPMGNHGELCG